MPVQTDLKTYDHLKIQRINGIEYIVKNISNTEINFFEAISHLPYIHIPYKISKDKAYYLFLKEGDITRKKKELFIQAIQKIADFHHQSQSLDFSFLPPYSIKNHQLRWDEIKILIKDNDLKLPLGLETKIHRFFDMISHAKTVIHDDLISLNILIDDQRNIKIIDWEHIKFGAGECDIGRFLGDLFYKNPCFKERYYNFEWHDDLIEEYLQTRKNWTGNIM